VLLQSLGSLLANTYVGVDGGRKESRGAFPLPKGLRAAGSSEAFRTFPYTVGCLERASCSSSVGSQRAAGRPAPTRKAVTSLAKRLSVTVPP
jgi:hypothetical protein